VRAVFISMLLVVSFASAALADVCPTCGGELTDKGRCPYCEPKPKTEREGITPSFVVVN